MYVTKVPCLYSRCLLIIYFSMYLYIYVNPKLLIYLSPLVTIGLPWWLRWQNVCLQCGRPEFNPWVRNILWRRKWHPTPVFLPGESHGRRSLVGYSPWGRKELDMTERFHFHFHFSKATGDHRCIWSREGGANEMVRIDWIETIGDMERQTGRWQVWDQDQGRGGDE